MNAGGTWSTSDGELRVKWPNGWRNVYEVTRPSDRLSGVSIAPDGRRVPSTLERRGPHPEQWILGSWTYHTSDGFTDTHTFLSDGRMKPKGSWSMSDGELVVKWPNGWRNVYEVQMSSDRLTGTSYGPEGQEIRSSLERQ